MESSSPINLNVMHLFEDLIRSWLIPVSLHYTAQGWWTIAAGDHSGDLRRAGQRNERELGLQFILNPFNRSP